MVFDIVNQLLNPIFLPLVNMDPNPNNPILAVFVIATIVAFIITLANKLLVDQDRMQFIQQEMKGFQAEVMEAQKSGDPKRMAEMQKKQMEFMGLQKEMMMNSFKPMIVTMLPILLIFWWMSGNNAIGHMVVYLPHFVYYILLTPLWHMLYHPAAGAPAFSITWLGWYILVSFAMSFVFRKFMGLKSGGM